MSERDNLKFPNTFLIGAPKCGTTTVAMALAQHQEIFLPSPKEPGFFATDLNAKNVTRITDESEYLRLFSAVGEGKSCAMDASVNYLYSSVAVKNILRFNSNAKFIVILRNPAEQVIAQHQEQVFNQNEDVQDFWTAWQLQGKRAQGHCIPETCSDPRRLLYRDRSSLGDQLERCAALIAPNKLFVRILEDLQQDPVSFYRDLQAFLDIKYQPLDITTKAKTSRQHRFKSLANLYQNPSPWSAPAIRWLKKTSRQSALMRENGLLRRFLVKPMPKPDLTNEQIRCLKDAFQDQVTKLETIMQRDLSHWKS